MRRAADLELARTLRASLSKLGRRLRAENEAGGIGSTALSVLGRLASHGPMAAGALAHDERLQPQSLTRVLKNLAERELISRSTSATDRRRADIEISATGMQLLETTVRRRTAWLYQTLIRELTPLERDLLGLAAALLDRLADTADSPPDDGPSGWEPGDPGGQWRKV